MGPCQGSVGSSILPGRTNRQARNAKAFRAFAVGSDQ